VTRGGDFVIALWRNRRLAAGIFTIAAIAASPAAFALSPRSGWNLAKGAEDLIQSGSWSCVSQVTANLQSLTIAATTGFVTPINTSGPRLLVDGDFSVLATLSAANSTGTYVTLVGTLHTGTDFWTGLKRLDVGISNGNFAVNYWTGDSANPISQTFKPAAPLTDPITLEAARIGNQIVIFANGAEAGRFADPGLFNSGQVYLGFNVAPQNTLTVKALAAAIPSFSAFTLTPFSSYLQIVARNGKGLRDLADQRGFLIGAAVDPTLFVNDSYARTLANEFNLVVAENAMKFGPTEPARGQYNFCAADQIVAFAKANGMKIRGHNMVWQQSLPTWLTQGKFSASEASQILHDHITAVASHYRGQVFAWDVVNEAIAYGAPYGPQPSYWLTTLGDGYIDQAFRWTREADPAAKLFYNDTGGEGLGAKSDAVYNLVSGLISRGVPLDGVGLQMHVSLAGAPTAAALTSNLKRLAALGLEIHITEMDVRIPVPATAADLAAQATVYQTVLSTCQANSSCTALLTWGVSDANSWIPGAYPGFGAALLFDPQFQPKPARDALAALLPPPPGSVVISDGGVVIHGGSSRNVSPGSLVDAYGANLGATTQLTVNGASAPLIYVSPTFLIFQLPYATDLGTAKIATFANGMPTATSTANVQAAAPNVLVYGTNRAVIQNQNYSVNSELNCAGPGTYAMAYLIGSGPLDNPIATGAVAPSSPLSRETLPTTVTVGGADAPVTFAGMAPGFTGLMQVNFQVPAVAAGDQPFQVTIGGVASNQPLFCVGH